MTMPCPRFALTLLAYADSFGAGEELVGDVLEEIGRGRSRWWVWQQLIGLYRLAFATHLRNRANVTPRAVAVVFCLGLLAGVSIAPLNRVLEAWLLFYFMSGTASLFAHMAAGASGARATEISSDADARNAG
jgi:hypothetical protein